MSQAELAEMLGVALNSLRMWDSGLRPTPSGVLVRAQDIAAGAVRDQELLNLPGLAAALNVHVRTLQAAARSGRLRVEYSTRSVFGRPVRLSTRAAGKAFLRSYFGRYGGHPPGCFELPSEVPADYRGRLRHLRSQLNISQADLAELVGAANKTSVYQWESGRRVPSVVFWERVMALGRSAGIVLCARRVIG